MNLKEEIEKLKLNSIAMEFDEKESTSLPIGTSKFGGRPHLPRGFQWPYFKGQSIFTGEIKDRPLSFLAQINCSEVKRYDADNRLPSTGILYFFYELESMLWGFDPKDKGCARVFYYDIVATDLVSIDFPEDMEQDFIMPELKITFEAKYNAPSYEELFDYEDNLWEKYDELLGESGYLPIGDKSSKLLGYADTIQGDMLLECELVTNGLYCGDGTGYNSPERKKLEQSKDQWKLLFQLDTVTAGSFELMFGDCGRIYYFIKEEDLKNKNFDNTWLVLQCG
jgi:uncharacterized protein YwqG